MLTQSRSGAAQVDDTRAGKVLVADGDETDVGSAAGGQVVGAAQFQPAVRN